MEAPLGVTVRGLVAGQVPDDERLVARAGQEHVGAGRRLVLRALRLAPNESTHFSSEVAREVTQPEWPSRVPRRTSCSAMIAMSGFCWRWT